MRLGEAVSLLQSHREEIAGFGVRSLWVFGSVARDEAGPESDVDVLVEFDRSVGLFDFVDLKMFLEGLLGRRVDLATPDALKETMRVRVLKEAIRAA